MDAMCNTKQDDVKNAVKAMRKLNYGGRITQIGQRPYTKLEKEAGEPDESGVKTCGGDEVNLVSGSRNHKHIINRRTGLIHLKGCKKVNKIKDGCRLEAALVNVGTTGLKTCKVCM